MRADRLVATLLVLQAQGRVTAAELADELEVSVKTARRDLEALAIAGIPVYSQAGKGGGWRCSAAPAPTSAGSRRPRRGRCSWSPARRRPRRPRRRRRCASSCRRCPRRSAPTPRRRRRPSCSTRPAGAARPCPARRTSTALQRAVVDGVQVRLGYADRTRSRDRAHRPPARARREGRRLVPRRRHRRRACARSASTGCGRSSDGRPGRAARRLRPGDDVGRRRRHDRGEAHVGARRRADAGVGPRTRCAASSARARPSSPSSADGRVDIEVGAPDARVPRPAPRRLGRSASRSSSPRRCATCSPRSAASSSTATGARHERARPRAGSGLATRSSASDDMVSEEP